MGLASKFVSRKQSMTDQYTNRRQEDYDHATRIALLEQSMSGIKGELSKINNSISKLVWVIVGTLLVAAINFILRGGLSHVAS